MGSLSEYISEFRREMANLGYADGEIGVFISDATDNKLITKISQQERNEIMEYLQNYLSFARKCKRLVMNSYCVK
jgi:hypothetical protein